MSEHYEEPEDLDEGLEPEEDGAGEPDAAAAEAERQAAVQAQIDQALNAERSRAGRELAAMRQELETLRANAPRQPERTAEPEPDDMPDPSLYPDDFRAWLARRDEQRSAQLIKGFEAQLGAVLQPVQAAQAHTALSQVDDVLTKARLGFLLGVPTFRDDFQAQLRASGIPPAEWTNPRTIRAVAGVVAAGYDELPEEPAPDAAAVTRAQQQAARQVGQRAAQQVAPSRGGGAPAATGPEVTQEERDLAMAAGMTVAEWRALGDQSGESYRSYRKTQNARSAARAGR